MCVCVVIRIHGRNFERFIDCQLSIHEFNVIVIRISLGDCTIHNTAIVKWCDKNVCKL